MFGAITCCQLKDPEKDVTDDYIDGVTTHGTNTHAEMTVRDNDRDNVLIENCRGGKR